LFARTAVKNIVTATPGKSGVPGLQDGMNFAEKLELKPSVMQTARKWIVAAGVFLLLLSGLFCACSRPEPTAGERLLGSWRSQKRKIHTILTFRANGTWTSQVRIEGGLSKIIEKKGTVTGTWALTPEGRLAMTATETPVAIGWEKDQPLSFEIVALTDSVLQLDNHAGRKLALARVKIKSQGADRRYATVDLEPIVVSLRTGVYREPHRFLCAFIGLVLKAERGATVHPKVREAILFHLSSLTYVEVNTNEELKTLQDDLYRLVNPYLKGAVSELKIKSIVITTQQRVVDEFLEKYAQTGEGRDDDKTAA
jgi:hypothetical protein